VSKLLNRRQVVNSNFNNLTEIGKGIVRKWNESGILDNFKSGQINIAELMEGEAAMMITQSFNLEYYTQRLKQYEACGDTNGIHNCLIEIVRLTTKKILEDHCG